MDDYSWSFIHLTMSIILRNFFFKDPSIKDAENSSCPSIPALPWHSLKRCRHHFSSPFFISELIFRESTSLPLDTKESHDLSLPWNGNGGVLFPQPFDGGKHLQMFPHCQVGPQHVLLRTVSREVDRVVSLMTPNWTTSFQFYLRK